MRFQPGLRMAVGGLAVTGGLVTSAPALEVRAVEPANTTAVAAATETNVQPGAAGVAAVSTSPRLPAGSPIPALSPDCRNPPARA
jgi:hypothetical protein